MNRWLIICALSLTTGTFAANSELKDNRDITMVEPTVQTVMATGTGIASHAPDQAIVSLGVSTTDATSAKAQQKLNTTMDAVVRAIKGLTIEKLEVQTQWMSLNPVYNRERYEEGKEPKIVGYAASNTVQVTIPDIARASAVIDAATASGANQVNGISFGLKDEAPAREEALRSAAQDARKKAEAIASALGLEVVRVLEARTGSPSVNQPYGRSMKFDMASSAPADAPSVVEPGRVTITNQVTVVLEVRTR